MTKTQKGFTLIELLVVIAIIGILAGILFVAIDPRKQTNKATDAKVKSSLASIRTQTALFFSEKNTYAGVCNSANAPVINLVKAANKDVSAVTAVMCSAEESMWVASGILYNGTQTQNVIWCVDSSGYTGYGRPVTTAGKRKCTPYTGAATSAPTR